MKRTWVSHGKYRDWMNPVWGEEVFLRRYAGEEYLGAVWE